MRVVLSSVSLFSRMIIAVGGRRGLSPSSSSAIRAAMRDAVVSLCVYTGANARSIRAAEEEREREEREERRTRKSAAPPGNVCAATGCCYTLLYARDVCVARRRAPRSGSETALITGSRCRCAALRRRRGDAG